MGIFNYIKDILLFDGMAIVPGLGCFSLKEEPARIEGNRISPPQSRVVFDPDQNLDNGILILKVSEGEEITTEAAGQAIQDYVDEILLSLDQGSNFNIKTMGVLYKDPDGGYHFDADPDLNIDFASFGLETFELLEIPENEEDVEDPLNENIQNADAGDETEELNAPMDKEIREDEAGSKTISESVDDEKKENDETKVEKFVLQDIVDDSDTITVNPEPSSPDQNDEYPWHVDSNTLNKPINPSTTTSEEMTKKREQTKKNRRTGWILVGSAVVLLLAFILLPLKTNLLDHGFNLPFLYKADSFNLDYDFTALEESDKDFESLIEKVENDIDSVTNTGNATIYSASEEVNEKSTGKYAEYHVIAGSFKSNRNAAQLQQKLARDGYPSLILERGDSFYRVSAEGFNDLQKALDELYKFRNRKGMGSAWLLGLN